MESNLDNDFTSIDFEHDPLLNKEAYLDQRIRNIFPDSTSESGAHSSLQSTPSSKTADEYSEEKAENLQDVLQVTSKIPSPPSPTQFIIDPGLASASNGVNVNIANAASANISTKLMTTAQPVDALAMKSPAVVTPKLSKWESPVDKIHRYQLRKETAKIKKNEYTARFIALKQASRKIDTRKPLPDRATVKILQVSLG